MKEIKLTQGKVALVDDEDFEVLNQFKWYAYKSRNTFYAGRKLKLDVNKMKIIIMHRELLGLKDSKLKGDHIDHNGLNNQKSNLRIATNSENCKNQQPRKGCSSKYKGVSWHKRDLAWGVNIRINGKQKFIGYFENETEGAKAYDEMAKLHFGKFACLNFPD